MSQIYPDTSPEIERLQIEGLRQMPVWRKLELVAELNQAVRTLALSGLRQRYPQDTPAQLRRRLVESRKQVIQQFHELDGRDLAR
mgnify:CR=1 FL=1